MNLKSKKQGFGNFQWNEQINSETMIIEFLFWLEKKTFDYDEIDNHKKTDWASIRMICRRTQLHHTTVKKAIIRLKEKFEILEVHGTFNSRLFCLSDSPNANHIRTVLKKEPLLAKYYKKYNSDEYVKKILLHPKFSKDGELIRPNKKNNPVINRIRSKSKKLNSLSIYDQIIKKRKTIHKKNKKYHDSKS